MKIVNIAKLVRYFLGLAASLIAILFILNNHMNLFILAASVYLLIICLTDTLYSKIPNIFTTFLIIFGALINIVISGLPGIIVWATGIAVGLSLLLIPFLMGGMGAGDVKALAAIGALLGPGETFQIFLYMALIGGLLGLIFHLTSKNLREEFHHYASIIKNIYLTKDYKAFEFYKSHSRCRFPYATAIAFGFFSHVIWGNIL